MKIKEAGAIALASSSGRDMEFKSELLLELEGHGECVSNFHRITVVTAGGSS